MLFSKSCNRKSGAKVFGQPFYFYIFKISGNLLSPTFGDATKKRILRKRPDFIKGDNKAQ